MACWWFEGAGSGPPRRQVWLDTEGPALHGYPALPGSCPPSAACPPPPCDGPLGGWWRQSLACAPSSCARTAFEEAPARPAFSKASSEEAFRASGNHQTHAASQEQFVDLQTSGLGISTSPLPLVGAGPGVEAAGTPACVLTRKQAALQGRLHTCRSQQVPEEPPLESEELSWARPG